MIPQYCCYFYSSRAFTQQIVYLEQTATRSRHRLHDHTLQQKYCPPPRYIRMINASDRVVLKGYVQQHEGGVPRGGQRGWSFCVRRAPSRIFGDVGAGYHGPAEVGDSPGRRGEFFYSCFGAGVSSRRVMIRLIVYQVVFVAVCLPSPVCIFFPLPPCACIISYTGCIAVQTHSHLTQNC